MSTLINSKNGKLANAPAEESVVEQIPAAILSELRALSVGSERSLWDVLEKRLPASPAHALRRLAITLGYPSLDMAALHAITPDFTHLPYSEALRRHCVVFRDPADASSETTETTEAASSTSREWRAVFTNPFDLILPTWLETRLGEAVTWYLVHPADFDAFLASHEGRLHAMDGALPAMAEMPEDSGNRTVTGDLSLDSIAQDVSPVVRLVHSTLFDAMKAEASDIHLETTTQGLHVKYRIDGVLTSVAKVPGMEMAEQVVSRVKVMAELDIAERRIPQDGRFKQSVRGQEIDFRVSVMPCLFGEDVVIRILDKRALADQIQGLRLDYLGFDADALLRIRRLAREPYGMLLVTGPTGSGKTTTLYAALTEINKGQDKIVTIEDPVEYQLPGILQIPVNEKKGLTFARGLRSILRHDPDKILVGEIRDPETAQIAIQSALTGHLVFTSVHANNVFDVLGRFLHMGVDTYSFVSALNGVLAQRLIRKVCTECAVPHVPTDEELAEAGLTREHAEQLNLLPGLKRGRGCGHCRGTGYKGRKAIAEILRMNDELREMIVARAPIRTIKDMARAQGTHFLRDSALAAAAEGWTTLEEINRVTFAE